MGDIETIYHLIKLMPKDRIVKVVFITLFRTMIINEFDDQIIQALT